MAKRVPALTAEQLPAYIESILFVAEAPVEVGVLSQALRVSPKDIEAGLAALEERCASGGTRLQRDGTRVQLVTAPEAGTYVERFLGIESRQRLSGAALESLAIIAYKQPVTRAGVEQIRGVNSDGAIASLIARGLVEEVGKAPGPGRPGLLGTTMRFLEHFGLSKPDDLPPLPAPEPSDAIPDDTSEPEDASEPEQVQADSEDQAEGDPQAESHELDATGQEPTSVSRS